MHTTDDHGADGPPPPPPVKLSRGTGGKHPGWLTWAILAVMAIWWRTYTPEPRPPIRVLPTVPDVEPRPPKVLFDPETSPRDLEITEDAVRGLRRAVRYEIKRRRTDRSMPQIP